MATSSDVLTEESRSRSVDVDTGEKSLILLLIAHGSQTDVDHRLRQNAFIPEIGSPWSKYESDALLPTALPDDRRLRVQSVSASIKEPDKDTTRHLVTVTYATIQPLDPTLTQPRLSLGVESFQRKYDAAGKPLVPFGESGVSVDVPTIGLSLTETVNRWPEIADRLMPHVGKTNSDDWMGLGPGQWVFMGAENGERLGAERYRVTFSFRGFPPISLGIDLVQDFDLDEADPRPIMAERRARFLYIFFEEQDGSIDISKIKPLGDPSFEQLFGSLRRIKYRQEIAFAVLFSTEDLEGEES